MVLLSALPNILPLTAHASGVSGGGGNVMFPVNPLNPAAVEEVTEKLSLARPSVASYFEGKEALLEVGSLTDDEAAIFAPLFQAGKGIVATARESGLEIEQNKPCFDSSATPFDGSTHSQRQGAVCVSALSISKKVERDDIAAQSAALLAHEFTEVLGFSEDHAVRVQSKVLADFRRLQP